MKHKSVLTILILISTVVGAKEKRGHKAHVHGSGNLSVAFDGVDGKVEFDGPAEGILGFEHTPLSAQDKASLNTAIQTFESSISQIVQFEPQLNCVFSKDQIGLKEESGGHKHHADFTASFHIKCGKSIVGSKIKFDFVFFPRVHDLNIIVLVDDVTKKVKLKKEPVLIELSK